MVLFPGLKYTFFNRYEARIDELEISEENIEQEGRYNETIMVLDTWIKGGIKHKLFGSEIFNDAQFYKSSRMLHTDYMVVFSGAGLVGLFIWLLIYYLMIREKERYWQIIKHLSIYRYYSPTFYSILSAQLLMSISGTIQGIDLRSFILLYLGALIGTIRGESYKFIKSGKRVPEGNQIFKINTSIKKR